MKNNAPSDYVPRSVHDRHITALTDRCIAVEQAVLDLLNTIDPEILQRHGHDWLAAVRELLK